MIAGSVIEEPAADNLVSESAPEPIHGAWIIAIPLTKGLPHRTLTHEDGSYKLTHLKPGKYIVAAWALGYLGEFYDDVRYWRKATVIEVKNNQVVEPIDFALKLRTDGAYSISGTISSSDSESQGEVMIYAISDSGTASFAFSDVDGSYLIDGLTPGAYKIEAVGVGYETGYYGGTEVASAANVTVGDMQSASDVNIQLTGSTTSVDSETSSGQAPVSFSISQNYPNPFNPTTEIYYQLPSTAMVSIKIYNMLGQEVRTLVNSTQKAGFMRVQWDGKNDAGLGVASGIYLYRFNVENATRQVYQKILKMNLVR